MYGKKDLGSQNGNPGLKERLSLGPPEFATVEFD
jgi:hypothetical protein